ncbi:MAG: hypothetical protein CL573_00745 [Alphaproteobacteria bacterium]|nr:hypothetical protein [Alphaproteobacteria bacterium]|tara:strand:- start:10497 stop:11015 length:519 start_codon:yes stop_codon:yes gene_type:complete
MLEEFSNRELIVLDALHTQGIISGSPYDISEAQLKAYILTYGDLFSVANGKLDSTNYRFARKLAGRTLIKHNLYLGAGVHDVKAGLVYVVSNPSFKDHLKIGMTVDLTKRLSSFQTYDPHRAFKVEHYELVLNRKATERALLAEFSVSVETGEWVPKVVKDRFFDFLLSIPE